MDDDGGRGLRRGWRGERFALWCTPTWLVMTYFCSLTNLATKCWKSLIFYNFASEASKIELIQIKSIFFLCWISEIGCISRTDTEFEKKMAKIVFWFLSKPNMAPVVILLYSLYAQFETGYQAKCIVLMTTLLNCCMLSSVTRTAKMHPSIVF